MGKHRPRSMVLQVGRETQPSPTWLRPLEIIEMMRESVVMLDGDFRVTQANSVFYNTFLMKPADTIGRVLFTLGDGHWNIAVLQALLRDKLVLHPRLHDCEVDHVFPGIGRKIMLLNVGNISDRPDTGRTILLAIEDVTERRFAEWRLAEHARELERSNTALDEFATIASHDLQEPLRKIISFGERLEVSLGATLEGDARHSLDRMLDAAARLRVLVKDVLIYSQVASRIPAFVPTDLAWVVRDVLDEMCDTITESEARVEVGALPVIDADPHQMRQLMQNLLSNAVKYAREGTPPFVKVTCDLSDRAHCTLRVSDTGIGFRQEHAEKIFLMFERLNGRSRYGGSGIGLAICRRIVERHHGHISAHSIPGNGATFSVTLPVTRVSRGSET